MMLEVLEDVDGTRTCPGIVQALVALFGTQMRHTPDDSERSMRREWGPRTHLALLSRAEKAPAAIGERAELLQRFFHDGVQPPAITISAYRHDRHDRQDRQDRQGASLPAPPGVRRLSKLPGGRRRPGS